MNESAKDEAGGNGNALLAAALAYAQKGWPVFPVYEPNGQGCSCGNPKCEHVAKHPRTPHGFHDATTDPEMISEWWRRWPNANVAVRTGSESGVVDLECDGAEGLRTLERLTNQGGRLPDTVQWVSERGPHRLFKHPGGELRSSASKLGPGLDLRGDGAYTIVPPSRHAGGFVRHWVNDEVPIAPLPGWWVPMLKAPPTERDSGNGAERIHEGARNATLASIAGTMRKRGLGEMAIRAALLEHNSRECDPPLPEAEVASIAASFAKYPPGAVSPPSDTQPKGFSLVRLGELLARPEVPVDWLWQGRLAAGTVSGVFSKGSIGSSCSPPPPVPTYWRRERKRNGGFPCKGKMDCRCSRRASADCVEVPCSRPCSRWILGLAGGSTCRAPCAAMGKPQKPPKRQLNPQSVHSCGFATSLRARRQTTPFDSLRGMLPNKRLTMPVSR